LRDGKWQEIPARELVPGDVVRVRLRDIVPADIKLMKGEYLLVDQSALTGESLPVEKHTSDVGYSGSPKLGLYQFLQLYKGLRLIKVSVGKKRLPITSFLNSERERLMAHVYRIDRHIHDRGA
jgi:P-type E1-E2 ATPase